MRKGEREEEGKRKRVRERKERERYLKRTPEICKGYLMSLHQIPISNYMRWNYARYENHQKDEVIQFMEIT